MRGSGRTLLGVTGADCVRSLAAASGAEYGAHWPVNAACSWGTEGRGRTDLAVWGCGGSVADGCSDLETSGCGADAMTGAVALLDTDAVVVVVVVDSWRKVMDCCCLGRPPCGGLSTILTFGRGMIMTSIAGQAMASMWQSKVVWRTVQVVVPLAGYIGPRLRRWES